ncbi:MAG: hypothetical protein DRP66_07430 [Planctomycetota bacterium]|nr:MAG: hypothetical protein DRP66_07430 [Planctomycetota bacterium]
MLRLFGNTPMMLIIYMIAGPMFVIAIVAHIRVKLRMRPGADSDLDEYHYEFEDHHPGYARYEKWSRITFAAAVISALCLFLALVF